MDQASYVREYGFIDPSLAGSGSYKIQGREAGKTSVPKFASFRPSKSTSGQDDEKLKTPRDPSRKEIHVIEGRPKEERPKHRHRHKSRDVHRRSQIDAGKLSSIPDTAAASHVQVKSHGDLFFVDRGGDAKNLEYGTLDKYAVSTYSRSGAGTVIGAESGLKIDRTVSDNKGILLSVREGNGRQEKHPLQRIGRPNSPVYRLKKDLVSKDELAGGKDFIYFGSVLSGSGETRDARTLYDLPHEDEPVDYRSFAGKHKPEEKHDPDLEHAPGTNVDGEWSSGAFNDQLRRRNAELTRHLDSEPDDVEKWLQLIHNQDKMLGPRPTPAERQSNADIKISILDKAINVVKSPECRQTLLIEMMEEAAKIWDEKRLSARWSSILRTNPNASALWAKFVDSKQTAFTAFRYEKVRTTFLDCIGILQGSMLSTSDIPKQIQTYENQVYILLRMTLYMRESGFTENAIAAWQAQLEFEFFTPAVLQESSSGSSKSHEEKVSAFEQFWESEVPRIGEVGSHGWAAFWHRGGVPPEPEPVAADQTVVNEECFATWLSRERHGTQSSKRPARTIDASVENDPYRLVLFSDIRPFLIPSPMLSCRHILFEAFLRFCQLPPLCPKQSGRIRYGVGFLSNEALNLDEQDLFSRHGADLPLNHMASQQPSPSDLPQQSVFDFPNLQCRINSEIMFAPRQSWFSAFSSWQYRICTSKSSLESTWVLNVLKSLMETDLANDLLIEYVLALELCLSPETARKTAKNVLKKYTSSLRLYNAYALVEYRLNKPEKGEQALIATVNMSKSIENSASMDSILLWRTWIWELLYEGKTQEALLRLQTYGDTKVDPLTPHQLQATTPNPTKVLRAANGLTAFRDHSLSLQSPEHAVLAMECLILLAYLQDTTTLTPALAAVSTNLALLHANSPTAPSSEETLRQAFAHLLYHHATHTHTFKPSDLRATLAQSIVLFPENTIFLSLYAWNESRFRIDDRVRAIVQTVLSTAANPPNNHKNRPTPPHKSLTPHLFAIHSELHRGVALGSNDHAIRASFERAVDSSAHCAGLWKMYFLFEHSRGNLKGATLVFYRAVTACPWVKELYLLPFEYLGGEMREAELRGVYDMMVQRELRVHVDLEELIEEREREREEGGREGR